MINWSEIRLDRMSEVEQAMIVVTLADKCIKKAYVIDDIINVLNMAYDLNMIDNNNYWTLLDLLKETKEAIKLLHTLPM